MVILALIHVSQLGSFTFTQVDNARLHQDAVFCEPLPMSPAMGGAQDRKYRSLSTGDFLASVGYYMVYWYAFSSFNSQF